MMLISDKDKEMLEAVRTAGASADYLIKAVDDLTTARDNAIAALKNYADALNVIEILRRASLGEGPKIDWPKGES